MKILMKCKKNDKLTDVLEKVTFCRELLFPRKCEEFVKKNVGENLKFLIIYKRNYLSKILYL